MRDITSCFSDHAANALTPSCSSAHPNNIICVSPTNQLLPSTRNRVAFLYKTVLSSSQKHLLINLTWFNSLDHTNHALSIIFNDDPSTAFKLNLTPTIFRKKKGTKLLELNCAKIDVLWDFSNAKFQIGPEPVEGFYVLIMADSQLALVLGDLGEEAARKKRKNGVIPVVKTSLISRSEHCSGNSHHYTAKAQFSDTGNSHDILIKCSDDKKGLKLTHPILSIRIDKKTVIRVKRLQWNFRGNQTVFVDGLHVELMWDVHDWFFNPVDGSAVFMFRTRNGIDTRLWLEDNVSEKDQEKVDFSLLIYASKSSM